MSQLLQLWGSFPEGIAGLFLPTKLATGFLFISELLMKRNRSTISKKQLYLNKKPCHLDWRKMSCPFNIEGCLPEAVIHYGMKTFIY